MEICEHIHVEARLFGIHRQIVVSKFAPVIRSRFEEKIPKAQRFEKQQDGKCVCIKCGVKSNTYDNYRKAAKLIRQNHKNIKPPKPTHKNERMYSGYIRFI